MAESNLFRGGIFSRFSNRGGFPSQKQRLLPKKSDQGVLGDLEIGLSREPNLLYRETAPLAQGSWVVIDEVAASRVRDTTLGV